MTDEYLTAPLDMATSECEDVHNVSGSMSENSTWDNYHVSWFLNWQASTEV